MLRQWSLFMKRETQVRSWGASHGEGNGYPLQYSCLENYMDRSAWRATVHGVTNNLSTTEWVQDSISLDSIVNLLCVNCSAHISLSLATKKSLIQKKSDPECRGGENMESGAWEQGMGSWIQGSWAGRGVNLGGGDSAFICITRTHCTQ